MKQITVQNPASSLTLSNTDAFTVLAGPCAIESRDMALSTAESLTKMCEALDIPLVYKSSFDKANRSSIKSPRGVGLEEGLKILQEVRDTFGCSVVTDVHLPEQCAPVGEVCDILQIPAFLCRQTDLLVAAAETGKAVNVKKGQFLAPWDMKNVVSKLEEAGNTNIMLCERGTSFGYNTLVVDMRGLMQMAEFGYPIVFDATHSVQQPGGKGATTGGQREFIPALAKAAVSIGVAALFIETHPNPSEAFSDGPNQVPLAEMPALLEMLKRYDQLTKETKQVNLAAA